VYFGDSPGTVGRMKIRFSKGNTFGRIEIRLGNQHGPVIGNIYPFYTGKSVLLFFICECIKSR